MLQTFSGERRGGVTTVGNPKEIQHAMQCYAQFFLSSPRTVCVESCDTDSMWRAMRLATRAHVTQ